MPVAGNVEMAGVVGYPFASVNLPWGGSDWFQLNAGAAVSVMAQDAKDLHYQHQRRTAIALFVVFGFIVVAVLAVLAALLVIFGDLDHGFQWLIQTALEARYNRVVEGLALWPWSFWIFFWGFVILLVFILVVVLYLTLFERKVLAWFQIRLGPNRVGPWGILQPFADMVKLLVKEDIVPRAADKWLHLIAPLFIFVPTLLAFVAIPFGAGTIELPQHLVAPAFDMMWVEWISEEDAVERGLGGPGWLEAQVMIEESEEFHKVWWVDRELDREPLFIPVDERGYPINEDQKYFRVKEFLSLPYKPVNPSDEPVYGTFFRIVNYGEPGREYDVLEVRFRNTGGHRGIVELGIDGERIEAVEEEYSEMLAGTGPDVPEEERFDFGDRPPKRYLEGLFDRFADAVAVNNREFSPASMVPAFLRTTGERVTWRDLYTPDWRHNFFIHGAVSREEEKASLYFIPSEAGDETGSVEDFDLEEIDWRSIGASFRLQRIDGGYMIETADGQVTNLVEMGDSVDLMVGDEPVTLTLKDTQYYTIYLMGKDLGIGIVYIMAVTSLAVIGIFMAGFGSNNKWSLYGAVRSIAQLMSYEVPMTLAVLGPVLMTGSLSMVDLVDSQRSSWFVLPQFLAFYVFMVCMTNEVNRNPFDLPEAESELVAGFHTEYTGLKFGFFFLAEYANMFLAACIMSVLFFGGWKGPFVIPYLGEFVTSFMWFMIKAVFWLGVFVWFRATFPRFRIDQMMDYAWKVLLPIALVNVVLTGYFTYSDWNFTIWQENNWRIVQNYIKPLFVNVYTSYYAIPAIVIIAILFLTDAYGIRLDRKRKAMQEGMNTGADIPGDSG